MVTLPLPGGQISTPLSTHEKRLCLSCRSGLPAACRLYNPFHLQLRLTAVLIDTATGNWVMLQPDPVTDKQISSIVSRESSDQGLLEKLKEQGYRSLASLLTNGFAD